MERQLLSQDYENQITWEMTGVEKRLATLFTQDSVIAAHKKTEEAKAKINEALSKH